MCGHESREGARGMSVDKLAVVCSKMDAGEMTYNSMQKAYSLVEQVGADNPYLAEIIIRAFIQGATFERNRIFGDENSG
jgi:hypothetical protein